MPSADHTGLPIVVTLALIVVALAYVRRWYQVRLPAWQLATFIGGLFSLWAAVGSPLAGMDHQLLTAHMVQHLLLMTVAAPLILLGAPVIALVNGISLRFVIGILGPYLRWPAVHWFGRILTHPIFCWLASTTTVIAWHVPSLFDIGMQS